MIVWNGLNGAICTVHGACQASHDGYLYTTLCGDLQGWLSTAASFDWGMGGNRCSIDETATTTISKSHTYCIPYRKPQTVASSRRVQPVDSPRCTKFPSQNHPTTTAMRFLHSFVAPLVLLAAGAAQAASSWGFDDATVQVNAKKAAGTKEKYVALVSDAASIRTEK